MRMIRMSSVLALSILAVSLHAADGGTVTGKVTWEGDIPKAYEMDLTIKPDDLKTCQCKPDETIKISPRLLVDVATKGVKNAVVTLEGVPADKAKDFPKRDVLIDQKQCEFHPHISWAEVDGKVAVKNSDATNHNLHAKMGDGDVFNVAMPTKDQTIEKKLKEPGIITLQCDAGHAWMSGFIFVMEHPYIAITDDKGAFSIDGVPPGKYKLKFWHEGWKIAPILDPKTQKPATYGYSSPLEVAVDVDVKAGATETNATLDENGFKK